MQRIKAKADPFKKHVSVCSTLFLLLCCPVQTVAGVTNLLYEKQYGNCIISASHDAVAGQPGVLVIRPHAGEGANCKITKSQVTEVLSAGLKNFRSRKGLASITSVFLGGRLIAYPWLSQYVTSDARTNSKWNVKKGKPVAMSSNAYLNQALLSSKLLEPFVSALSKFNYNITGVSCEKVLINENKLPYDGMCWLEVRRLG